MSGFSHIPPVGNTATADASSDISVPHCLDGHTFAHQQKNYPVSRIPRPILRHEQSDGLRDKRASRRRVATMNSWARTAYETLSRAERLTYDNQGSEQLTLRARRTHARAPRRKRDSSRSSVITVLRVDQQGTEWELDETSRVVWLGPETLLDQANTQGATTTHGTKKERSDVASIRQLDNETFLRHDRDAAPRSDGETIRQTTTKSYTLVPRFRLRENKNGELPSDSDKKLRIIAQALRKFNVETPSWCDGEATSQSNGGYAQQHDVETIHPPPTTSYHSIPKFRLRRRKDVELPGDDEKRMNDVDANNGTTAASKLRLKFKMARRTQSVERDEPLLSRTDRS